MKHFSIFAIALASLIVGCNSGASAPSGTATTTTTVSYDKVQAVLTEKCAGCHGATNPKDGISLTSFEAVTKGGPDGPIVKPGDAAGSLLVKVMRHAAGVKPMPPKDLAATEEQIKTVEDWINGGAKAG